MQLEEEKLVARQELQTQIANLERYIAMWVSSCKYTWTTIIQFSLLYKIRNCNCTSGFSIKN